MNKEQNSKNTSENKATILRKFNFVMKIWDKLASFNKLIFFNIALLGLVVALLVVMYLDVKKMSYKPYVLPPTSSSQASPPQNDSQNNSVQNNPSSQSNLSQNNPIQNESTKNPLLVLKQNQPTIVIARNSQPKPKKISRISLPLRREKSVRTKPICWKTRGDIMIDGRKNNQKLPEKLTVKGNLYLQNLHSYTLPCNTNIHGNLLLRNVKLLKFCGKFNINGNIFVSHNSSFGSLPKDAHLGGTIIF